MGPVNLFMNIVLLGPDGRLGTALRRECLELGVEFQAVSRRDVDIVSAQGLRMLADVLKPHDVVVNAAAYTAVDAAEEHPDAAYAANAVAVERLARMADQGGVRLVHISTDYVFGNGFKSPIPEDADTLPLSVYGRSKRCGELAALSCDDSVIIRTAWLFGHGGQASFVRKMWERACGNEPSTVVSDQVGQPSFTRDVATYVMELALNRSSGVYHVSNSGETSWFELARHVYALAGADPQLVAPVSTAEYGAEAMRPSYSALGHQRLDNDVRSPRPWRAAVRAYLSEIGG